MKNHFEKGVNIKGLIKEHGLHRILEVGAFLGENTRLLASLDDKSKNFMLTVIDDGPRPALPEEMWWVEWRTTDSLTDMPKLPSKCADLILLDSDHNYYTCIEELKHCERLLVPEGFVALHDTTTFAYTSGWSGKYKHGGAYPEAAIKDRQHSGKGLMDAVEEFCKTGWEIVRQSDHAHGAVVIRRKS